MSKYIVLMKFTSDTASQPSRFGETVDSMKQAWESLSGQRCEIDLTQGQYDAVLVGQAGESEMLAFISWVGRENIASTETLTAYDVSTVVNSLHLWSKPTSVIMSRGPKPFGDAIPPVSQA